MATLLPLLDFLFGCHHVHLSRVFTVRGETYRVCCDCGAKYAYSLDTMSLGRRLPPTSVSTGFQSLDRSRRFQVLGLALEPNGDRAR